MRHAQHLDRGSRSAPTVPEAPSELSGMRILVVEDVGMVSAALKSVLEDLGCVVIGTASRLRDAELIAKRERLDGALLDLNLGGEYSFPIADLLVKRGIPFIFMSGYDVGSLDPRFATWPQMQKPFERESLRRLMCEAFRPPASPGEQRAGASIAPTPAAVPRVPTTPMRTRGELESAVGQGMSRFEQEYIGRGPRDVHAHLIGDLLIIRLYGVLTAAEQHLAATLPADHGRRLIKEVRRHLIEGARRQIESMVQMLTGVRVLSLHHDISTVTAEEVVVFTLSEEPPCRELRAR